MRIRAALLRELHAHGGLAPCVSLERALRARHLDDDWLAGKPAALATLLGRDDFLEHRRIAEGFADPSKLAPVFASVQSPESLPRKR